MPSWSTLAYLFGLTLMTIALSRRLRRAWVAGLAVLLLTGALRLVTAERGESMILTTTGGGGASWLARLVDEGDIALTGARVLTATHRIHDPDAPRVPDALASAYRRMRAEQGDAPSPVLLTWAGLEPATAADVLVFEGVERPRGALIFLHGFGGNFALPAWQLARAARQAGLVTFCPSVGWRGDWWENQRTLENTVALVRRRGFDRIYLAGLSNGAAGVAKLAPRMRGTFRGIILISGAAGNPQPPGVPVLVLQGRRDTTFGAGIARAYAARTDGEYVDLDAGHFAFLLCEEQANRAIAMWLTRN